MYQRPTPLSWDVSIARGLLPITILTNKVKSSNYGHGQPHLSRVLATLILLAYLMRTTRDRLDPRYRAVRAQLPLRQTCFEHLRALLQYLPCDSWGHLFDFMLDDLRPAPRKDRERPNTGWGQIWNSWV